jgi:hypothetical protein
MTTSRTQKREQDGHGYYQNYAEYNRTLRAWFVVFGVGGPATLIVNKELSLQLAQAGALRYVVALFLIGAAAQVAIALVNKTASWYCYAAELNPKLLRDPVHRFWAWVNQQFILDVVMDLISVVTFTAAIWELFRLVG